ncbi:MAG: GNAT family N-acetyltransferase [Verrucomicrobiae bacterium]|nr:GNAT family N-acetyltransferase [Verrucomicrobiae bacterium]
MDNILHPVWREIPGERVILKCPEEGDGGMVYEAVVETLDDLRRWPASLPWAVHEPSVEASEVFCRLSQAQMMERTGLVYLILDAETRALVGSIGVNRIDWRIPRFEIGFWCRSSCQGRGYLTEALRVLIGFLLDRYGARRIECFTDLENRRARALCERAGMIHEATIRNDRITPDGQLRHTVIYSIVSK